MKTIDPLQLEIFKSLFHSIAEEMGATLKRTAFSPNIKERRDYSCALFDPSGVAVASSGAPPRVAPGRLLGMCVEVET